MAYVSGPVLKQASKVFGVQTKQVAAWSYNLAVWGAAAGAGAAVFTENWPLFQKTFYQYIPVLGNHWLKPVDPQDVPQ